MRPRRFALAFVVAIVAGVLPAAPRLAHADDGDVTAVPRFRVSVPETVIAGESFAIVVTALAADGSTDTTYCPTTCTLVITPSASIALDGTMPTPARGTTVTATFIAGSWESGASFLTFYRAERAIVIVSDADLLVGGTSAPILVTPTAVSSSLSGLSASARTVPADGASEVSVWARIVDTYQNPRADLTVTLSSTLGVLTGNAAMAVTGTGSTAAARLRSASDGIATVSATLSGEGRTAPMTLRFVASSFHPMAGSYYGTVADGATTKYDLEVTAFCGGTCTERHAAGQPFAATIAWSAADMATGASVGSFDAATTSGSFGDASHRTAYRVADPGRICVTASWTDPDGSTTRVAGLTGRPVSSPTGCAPAEAIAGVGLYEVASTTAGGTATYARALWDGAAMRVIGWWTK